MRKRWVLRKVYELNNDLEVFIFHCAHLCGLVTLLYMHLPICKSVLGGGEEPHSLLSVSTGIPLGMFMAILLGGIISQAFGWPFVFYTSGKSCLSPSPNFSYSARVFYVHTTVCTFLKEISQNRKILETQNIII